MKVIDIKPVEWVRERLGKKMFTLVTASCALVFGAQLNAATYTPAMFDFDEQDIKSQVNTALEVDSAVFYCQSDISVTGTPKVSRCYSDEGREVLSSELELAINSLGFKPATVNGEPVPVRLSFRVVLGKTVHLIPNLGTMQEKFGRHYIAPQERLDISDWYQRYSQSSWVSGEVFFGAGELSRIGATVDKDGRPQLIGVVDASRARRKDTTLMETAVKRSRFIPGFVDGKAVAMAYLVVVNYPESAEAVGSR